MVLTRRLQRVLVAAINAFGVADDIIIIMVGSQSRIRRTHQKTCGRTFGLFSPPFSGLFSKNGHFTLHHVNLHEMRSERYKRDLSFSLRLFRIFAFASTSMRPATSCLQTSPHHDDEILFENPPPPSIPESIILVFPARMPPRVCFY